tara:strand:- start:229 stop:411 length:183 start_codon:yes stop_codon:yes gene_type:complete
VVAVLAEALHLGHQDLETLVVQAAVQAEILELVEQEIHLLSVHHKVITVDQVQIVDLEDL